MRARDLELKQLFEFDDHGGILRFAGERALLFDAVALGLLRRELIETIGDRAARGVLTRFGYAHGWRTAETLEHAFDWESPREWRIAGGRLHRLQGLVNFEPEPEPEPENRGPDSPFAAAVWRDSYEAEQHLLHQGLSREPVCWTLAGFASGYLSRSNGADITCVETRCRGAGATECRMEGRTREAWAGRIDDDLAFYKKESLDESLACVAAALKKAERKLRATRDKLEARKGDADVDPSGIVARSAVMRRLLDVARRAAKVDATVLVAGESGSGKEGVARLVHFESARAAKPFLAINCAAVPESLLESELFGHARGAFTGATNDRVGLFEATAGGTLFLDEIGDVPLGMQAKLLRVLEERVVRRVGENKSRPVDARIVAATHRDLHEEIAAGRFRQDLFYRLRVIELRVPPLRERRDDVLPLARELLASRARRSNVPVPTLTPRASRQLLRYAWPGNVRELANVMERALVFAESNRVDVGDLPDEVRGPSEAPGAPTRAKLADVEREHILAVLRANGGHRARAAVALDIGTATLFRKLKAYAAAGVAIPPAPFAALGSVNESDDVAAPER